MKAGWENVQIGDVCDLMTGGTPSRAKPEYFNGGTIRWLVSGDVHRGEIHDCEGRITELGMNNSSTRLLPLNSVIIALNGQGKTRGSVALLRVPATCNQSLVSINPRDHSRLNPEFLFWNLRGRYEEIRRITGDDGNDRRGLNMPLIRRIRIPIPPLSEQRRIVAVLDKAFAGIATTTANAQKNLTNARELSTACPTGSSAVERVTIGELLERRWLLDHMDGNHGADYPRKDEFVADGVTYLSANSIRDGEVDFSRAKFLAPARAAKLRKGFARDRDVLFAHNATVGPVALLETEAEFVVLGTSLTYYRCDESRIKPEYLASYLASSAFKVQYESVMRQSTRNQVPITKQRDFYVDVPSIDEQSRMVASLVGFQDSGRRLVKQYQAKLAALSELKQSLLQKAFAGALT